MNKEYKIKLDLNKKLYNKKMAFNQFDENVNDFYIEVTKNNEVVKDLDKSIITLVAIKPNNTVDAQFIEVKEGQIYADLKPSMCDLVGNYQAKAMIVLEGEIVTTDTINYSVNEDKIISKLNDDVVSDERFTLFTDALARLSTIEISEEQRQINEAERILSEENRKIEEAKRVEAELIRQHEEADRTKYDAIRESNENIRKQNESIRLANETNRIDEEAKRVEEENKRKLAEEERNANYDFMTEDEERRRSEANAHKEAEVLRVQAETNRVNEEAKRRTTEQGRVSAENTRVSNENTRKDNETTRQTNETQRVEAESQRQSRYNSFIVDAEANANNFENYTNNAKVKEEERKSNELDRQSQEDRRVSNEAERISNENTRKASEVARENNETSRQNIFENKVNEVDEKIIEINATKDNFISSINTKVDTKISELNTTKENFISSVNTKVDNKISEIEVAKSDMTTTVTNKIDEVENRFNALTSKQQQDAEVIDARDGETSLKARLDRDIEKAKQVYVNVEGSNISTDSSVGYLKDVEILGNTIQSASNLADIRSVGEKIEGQELYEIPVLSVGKNLFDGNYEKDKYMTASGTISTSLDWCTTDFIKCKSNTTYTQNFDIRVSTLAYCCFYDTNKNFISSVNTNTFTTPSNCKYIRTSWKYSINGFDFQLEEGTQATPYEPYQEDKLTILSPTPLEKVGDVADRLIEKDGVWGVEKNIETCIFTGEEEYTTDYSNDKYFSIKCKNIFNIIDVNNDSKCIINNKSYINKSAWIESNFSYGNDCIFNSTNTSGYFQFAFKREGAFTSLNGCVNYIKNNNLLIKVPLKQPIFIPLPHSQQVKLRTFANKTNISFLTEIEGTIKAQVPKSLGATVNTHTEQISNLNKELDRVKKLEESTVSTVETERDFTTVEATSNGYFEDVKLEGKTLVNLCGNKPSDFHFTGNNNIENNIITAYGIGMWSNFFDVLPSTIKPNTEYTIVLNVISNSLPYAYNGFVIASEHSMGAISKTVSVNTDISSGVYVFKVKTKDDLTNISYFCRGYVSNTVPSGEIKFSIMYLEGDHTQNPPSYFEGLKSVGQSGTTSEDGVDEIVVSSVKGDGNLFDVQAIYNTQKVQSTYKWYVFKGKPNTQYIITSSLDKNARSKSFVKITDYAYTNTLAWLCHTNISNVVDSKVFTTDEFGRIGIAYNNVSDESMFDTLNSFAIYEGTTPKPYTSHQSDKKRLLYYNNETQTWEKPVLRQWDSIEKHADGKYYYHQRSGEVVLNGSENWSPNSLNTVFYNNVKLLNVKAPISNSLSAYIPFLCDRLVPTNIDTIYNNNIVNGIGISKDSNIGVSVDGRELGTFKQWLQANNVTVVYQLAQEKVYECTNIDLITYANETNYVVECGAIVPKTILKVHNNISNVVSLLQKKVSVLESNMTNYMITQNRLMLASRYNADTVSFKVDVATLRNSFEYDNDLYELILNNILVGKDNYNREYIENLIVFYWMDFVISDEMYSTLFEIIEEQHNPKLIEEETPLI